MSVRILNGDCRDVLKTLPDESVNCVVTSPPYFGLRDYGVAGQIGLEPTPADFVAEMVAVFREVRRVLRGDGTCWLNLGDSYARAPAKGGSGPGGKNDQRWGYGEAQAGRAFRPGSGRADGKVDARGQRNRNGVGAVAGMKDKDLIGIPWRVAFALQDDGWYLRQDIIWHKPNPMPESVTDRCTKAHEYLFLLTKRDRYVFDNKAIQEDAKDWSTGGPGEGIQETQHYGAGNGGNSGLSGLAARYKAGQGEPKRNRRSVWTVPTQAYSGAHFATFPPALIEPCILAGCAAGGVVLDPFGGAGTTGLVADRLGRNAILIELNPEYAAMAERRVHGDSPLFADVSGA